MGIQNCNKKLIFINVKLNLKNRLTDEHFLSEKQLLILKVFRSWCTGMGHQYLWGLRWDMVSAMLLGHPYLCGVEVGTITQNVGKYYGRLFDLSCSDIYN